MEEQAFRDFLKTNVPQEKTCENLLKVAEYIKSRDCAFFSKFSQMDWYYKNVFCLDRTSMVFQFAMHDYLKEFYTVFATLYGLQYIDMMNAHFSS